MNGTEIFARTPAYDRELAQIRLRPPAWKLLLALDGNRTVSEVSLAIGMPLYDLMPLAEEFTKKGWVEEQALTLDQYLKSNGSGTFAPPPQEVLDLPPAPVTPSTPSPSPQLKEPPLPAVAASPRLSMLPPPLTLASAPTPEKVMPQAAPVLSPPKIISAPLKSSTPFVLAAKALPQAVPAPVPVKKQKLRLQAVVDFLVSQGETKILGQLLVYRTFVRIPSELLDNANLAAVQLVNDPALIEDEPLQKAILRTVEETVDAPLPNTLFIAA